MTTGAHCEVVKAGDILADKYRVEQVLGIGGMGIVVAAEHIALREKVAIKFLLEKAAEDSEVSQRFLREARAAVKIKSEHVVRITDVGSLPSGAPYMVMEYLEGEDLSQTLERGPVPVHDAVDYLIQSCEAMSVAHRSGIVHRDLKPANLFLTRRPDGSPLVKVLDFGISKVNDPEAASLSLTHTHAMMGSPLYMSPEHMRSSRDADRLSDIWSLGIILYELLSGDVPFNGESFPDVLLKVMTEDPPSLNKHCVNLPVGLEAVVERCLAKKPGDRFSSVAALAVALTPFASPRTLGLQGRLEQSVSLPSGPSALPSLVATRPLAESSTAAPSATGARGLMATKHEFSPNAEPSEPALPSSTNTAWEGHSQSSVVLPLRSTRPFLWATGLGLVVAVAALGFGSSTDVEVRNSNGTSSASAAPSEKHEPAAPLPALTPPSPPPKKDKLPTLQGVPPDESTSAGPEPIAPKLEAPLRATVEAKSQKVTKTNTLTKPRRAKRRRTPPPAKTLATTQAKSHARKPTALSKPKPPTRKAAPPRKRTPSLSIDFK